METTTAILALKGTAGVNAQATAPLQTEDMEELAEVLAVAYAALKV